MKIISIFIILLLCCSMLSATIRTVKQDGTGNYTVIQTAINASVNLDTILVYPGTYFENVNFTGKNVYLTSLYYYQQADSLIARTVIDGNNTGACVSFINDEGYNAVLNGFTLIHGSGYTTPMSASNGGGGVYIYDTNPQIKNCVIRDNRAMFGGGICVSFSIYHSTPPIITNCSISGNMACMGGGININNDAFVQFDTQNLSSIYNNFAGAGHDIFCINRDDFINIPLDTCTIAYEDSNFVYFANQHEFSAQNSTLELVNHDLYVSPEGNDNNNGYTPETALRTVANALRIIASDPVSPKTIYLAPGTYSRSLNEQIFPLNMKSYIIFQGENKNNTFLDADNYGGMIYSSKNDRYFSVKDLTIKNCAGYTEFNTIAFNSAIVVMDPIGIKITNCDFVHNTGGSIYRNENSDLIYTRETDLTIKNINSSGCQRTDITLRDVNVVNMENIVLHNNELGPDNSMAIPLFMGDSDSGIGVTKFNISNLLINNNHNNIEDWPDLRCCSAILVKGDIDATIVNSTITGNISTPNGGALFTYSHTGGSTVKFYNTIFYDNSPTALWMRTNDTNSPNNWYFNNCLIEGGQSAIHFDYNVPPMNILNWGEGNINEDPLWLNTGQYPYQLSGYSPCIDAGTTDIPDFEFPETDLAGNPRIAGNGIDIGAYEFQPMEIDFTAEPRTGHIPLTVQFNSLCPPEATTYAWDFNNDGTIDSNEPNPQWIFTTVGLFTVKFVVNNGAGIEIKEDYIETDSVGNNDVDNPLVTGLNSISPNPFRSSATLKIAVAKPGKVQLDVYNIKGQRIQTLQNVNMPTGSHTLTWDGRNSKKEKVSSGIYTIVMKYNGQQVALKKITVIK